MNPTKEQLENIISERLTQQHKLLLCLIEVECMSDIEVAAAMHMSTGEAMMLYTEAVVIVNAEKSAAANGFMTEAAIRVRIKDKNVMADMTPKQRRVIKMKHIEGLTTKQIAIKLGVRLHVAQNRLCKARLILENCGK